MFFYLVRRWRDLFNVSFDVLLPTSTDFEINAAVILEGDKRPDCPQVAIALVVKPDGLPLAYEIPPGNTAIDVHLPTNAAARSC